MIRFTCDKCGKPLRAPDTMAGRRGKCARCGGVNRVPPPVLVEVKRAGEPSPFRDVDRPIRSAIEGAMAMSEPPFLADAAATATMEAEAPPSVFRQRVTPPEIIETPRPTISKAITRAVPIRRAVPRANVAPEPEPLSPVATDVRIGYQINFDTRPADLSRAVWAAMVVGAVVGFGLGLLVAKWVV